MNDIKPDGETYHILIKGHISERREALFEGMSLTLLSDGTTLLCGPIIDQTALHSILLRVRNMNLKLISVNKVEL